MVYVLNIDEKPLMPCKEAKARKLLRDGLAIIVNRTPFTIQLTFECENKVQNITLGVDAGSKTIGLSATTKKQELFSGELQLRTDIVDLLSTRRQNRRIRRNRLRYREARFLNRTSTKKEGWLAPSIQNKISSHLSIIEKLHLILPITEIVVEVASFDIQKINNPEISGKEYQQGDQLGFWNVREYVLFRDGHNCQGKKGCKEKILNVHHIESRKYGGNSPGNLITLCETCHTNFHSGELKLELKRKKSFRDATFMGIMRWSFYNKLRKLYSSVHLTYGYITKHRRISNGLAKTHVIDAYCIANNLEAKRLGTCNLIKQVRKKKRSLHEAIPRKGRKEPNRLAVRNSKNTKQVIHKGLLWCLLDKVILGGRIGMITGFTGNTAYIRDFNGEYIQISPKYKQVSLDKLQLICRNNNWICQEVTL